MTTSKRERQKAGHRARLAAERRYVERDARRRRFVRIALVVGGVAAVALLFVVLSTGGDSTTTAASTTTTSTAAPVESAAGKPCVAFDDTLPDGAPDVPVPEGEPPTELVVEDLVTGSGDPVAVGDDITAQYIGVSCSTGKIFDSSWEGGAALELPLEEVGLIQGWVEGIPGMQPGGRRLLVVPPDLAYGSTGSSSIAPDETLVFVIDLESATPGTTSTTATP